MELGFGHLVLDLPANRHADWLMDEWWGFTSATTSSTSACPTSSTRPAAALPRRDLLRPGHAPLDARRRRRHRVRLRHPGRIATVLQLFPGRRIAFSTVEPAARALFYQMIPGGNAAPPGMTKGEVYAHNVCEMARVTDLIIDSARGSTSESTSRPRPRRRRARR
jgi:hypothetical protein